MYKKYMAALLFINLIAVVAILNITGLKVNHIMSQPAFKLELKDALTPEKETSYGSMVEAVSSGQRVIAYEVAEKVWQYDISQEDYDVLLRIVEAEAGGEDAEGKMLVAGVVLNRVKSEDFPDTVKEVVFQKENGTAQFSPVYSGRYDSVVISEDTINAVDRVLSGEDISNGALYFAARKYADSTKMKWFDDKLTFLFSHGGHEFFN
ncbi:MAG TPA: cell wall hydrolase [Lachnospiraceae bacterium]|nr:cell wall hydrolase [Lachnospiraceae bacterium]